MAPASTSPPRPFVAGLLALCLVGALVGASPPAAGAAARAVTGRAADCRHPDEPKGFHRRLATAIRVSGDLQRAWASSPYIAKIVCWQGTGFDTEFVERGQPYHVWHGLFAMTTEEVETMFGPWMTRTRDDLWLDTRCFVKGWTACRHTVATTRSVQQIVAGLRWIWLLYGNPTAAWGHIERTGRFNSYPRTGTNDTPTHDPLRVCPVAGQIGYQDDFGEPRPVGGYHPHWGNDIGAPTGRPIRAPFDGFAVAHSDDWFAGHYVTVVGERGYVRNGHLSRFGRLGYVKAGTVIGYVGSTGDAHSTHDHFEWHPWASPTPRHRSPRGFSLIMDAIDPYPFLNRACGARRAASGSASE